MAVPTWVTGQVLTASDVNLWFVPLVVTKASDTSRTSNTTLAADPELVLAIAANALYDFSCYINYEGAATGAGDLKWNFTVPAGATLRYQSVSVNTVGTLSPLLIGPTWTGSSTNSAGTNGAGNAMSLVMTGQLDTAGTSGSITLQWAQNASSATSTIVHTQSQLRLQRTG